MFSRCHSGRHDKRGRKEMSTRTSKVFSRRETVAGMSAAAAFMSTTRLGWAASKVAPITIVINQSPWFDSFRKTVEIYEKESGNKVELDVNPFAGSLEKQRNSVRASQGQYDLLDHELGMVRRDVFRRVLGCRSATSNPASNSIRMSTRSATPSISIATKKTMTPAGKLMSMPIIAVDPAALLPRRPLQGRGT